MREEITIRADELPDGVGTNYLRFVAKTLGRRGNGATATVLDLLADRFDAPVKPPEPTGLGAVVEDDGRKWVRMDNSAYPWAVPSLWAAPSPRIGVCHWRGWGDFGDDVAVLHDGWDGTR